MNTRRYPSTDDLVALLATLRQEPAPTDALWEVYFAGLGVDRDDLSQAEFAATYCQQRFLLVNWSYPPTLDHIHVASVLIWIYGALAFGLLGVQEVWAYLTAMAQEERVMVAPEQRAAAVTLLKALAARLLPEPGKGLYSPDRAAIWLPDLRRTYEHARTTISAVFAQHTTVAARADALHAAYPDIPRDTFASWLEHAPTRGRQPPRHNTPTSMTIRVVAWHYHVSSAESVRKLLQRAPRARRQSDAPRWHRPPWRRRSPAALGLDQPAGPG